MILAAPEVKLTRFEGPLDLLLYLIHKQEIDIHDINISEITRQYLDAIEEMRSLNLEVAGDFIMMVAYLLFIKAQMLLPQPKFDGEMEEDPRRPLVERLLEYQKFKQIGEEFKRIENERAGVFPRGFDPASIGTTEALKIDFNIFDLYKAYIDLVKQSPDYNPALIAGNLIDIEERMNFILDKFNGSPKASFLDLTAGLNRLWLVATFIALLELIKRRRLTIKQAKVFGNISIYRIDN